MAIIEVTIVPAAAVATKSSKEKAPSDPARTSCSQNTATRLVGASKCCDAYSLLRDGADVWECCNLSRARFTWPSIL
jgi:hypothetical protein